MENKNINGADNGKLGAIFRSLPDFKGKRRLGRFLFGNRIANGREVEIKGKLGCVYKLPHLREAIAYDIFVNGIYEEETHEFLVSRTPAGSTFLDLGTNIGSICIPLCKSRPDLRCIGVEAAPWLFSYLQHNINRNGLQGRITCLNKALSHQATGPLPFYSPAGEFGKGSLSPVFTSEAVMVDTITVDDIVATLKPAAIRMVKIDIEGFEYFAFKGGINLLKDADAPDILFEFVDWAEERANLHKGAAQELLKGWGYHIYLLKGKNLIPLKHTLTTGGALLFASKRLVK